MKKNFLLFTELIHPKNCRKGTEYAVMLEGCTHFRLAFMFHHCIAHRFGDKDFCVDFWHIHVDMSDSSFFSPFSSFMYLFLACHASEFFSNIDRISL